MKPVLTVTSSKPEVGGVPEAAADGADKHVLTILKWDADDQKPILGTEALKVIPSQLIAVNLSKPVLVEGRASVEVGPTTLVGDMMVRVVDQAGVVAPAAIRIRFV